jgi:hypothetical protein
LDQPIYVAIVGTKHYYGTSFLKPEQIVYLIKDPDNAHDHEAIKAELFPVGKIGYVANSPQTVPRGCCSAGRVYDKFEDRVCAIVRFVVNDTVIARVAPEIKDIHIVHSLDHQDISFKERQEDADIC